MVPRIFTFYEPAEMVAEINSGEILVEPVYVDHNELIESMIFAGERLNLARKEAFHQSEEEDFENAEVDPTMAPGFDLADVSRLGEALDSKAKAFAEEKRKSKEKEIEEKNKKLKEDIIAEYERSKKEGEKNGTS